MKIRPKLGKKSHNFTIWMDDHETQLKASDDARCS